jgi:hypothetical protein
LEKPATDAEYDYFNAERRCCLRDKRRHARDQNQNERADGCPCARGKMRVAYDFRNIYRDRDDDEACKGCGCSRSGNDEIDPWADHRVCLLKKSQIKRAKKQDDSDIRHQPFPEPVSEKKEINGNHNRYQQDNDCGRVNVERGFIHPCIIA